MSLLDLVKKNRSYRGYDETRTITREELLDLVDLSRFTPSSINQQPLKYVLLYQEDEVKTMRTLVRWARALPEMQLPHEGKQPTAFIIICQDRRINDHLDRFQKDVGIVAQTILLGAVEKGLGGCMIGNFKPEEVSGKMGLPENLAPLLVLAIGKPDEQIRLVEIPESGNSNYYRDEQDVHYVPKRALSDIVLEL